jgi:Tfp pilus assembly protein PilF
MEKSYPGSRNDVVEIDPEVTKAAYATFNLPETSSIRSFHEDARVYVDRLKRMGSTGIYDVVYVDAFNHHSVPVQLTTAEFAENVREILKPEGAYLINMIDTFDDALFLGAMVNTMSSVFPHVYVFVEGVAVRKRPYYRNIFVVVATNQPFDGTDLSADCDDECDIFELDAEDMAYLREKTSLVLTDDYAPVENLLASVVRDGGMDRALGDWTNSIRKAAEAGNLKRAVKLGRAAVDAFPSEAGGSSDHARLWAELGNALKLDGQLEEAERSFEAARKLHPGSVRARLGLIDCYQMTNRLEESLPLFKGLLDYDPLVRYSYATVLAQLGRFTESVVEFEIVTQRVPGFASAYNNWGTALMRMGDREGAIEKLQLALQHDPNHPDARRTLAGIQANGEEAR